MTARKHLPSLYLASQSPRRREILADLGIPFTLRVSPYQESTGDVVGLLPKEQAARLAGLKAFHAAKGLGDGIVIGADTIVVLDEHVLGKPRDRADAKRMLGMLSGKSHRVITGISLVEADSGRAVTHAEITHVVFKSLSDREITDYIDSPEPYDKAGAYAIQGMASLFVERIEGCYFNVVGFPVVAFGNLMKHIGIDIMDYVGKTGKKAR
ncbi:MAG TPA: Maf family protein [Candidatus Ozemobacteraceae bacterium]